MEKRIKTILIALFSGLAVNLVNTNLWILLSCVAVAPLFFLINKSSKKESFFNGFVFGFGIGIGMFYWMIKGVSHYTGNGIFYGISISIISSLFLGIYFALLSWLIKMIWISKSDSKYLLISNRICIAAIWALFEFGLSYIFESFPLHYFRIGFSFVTNIYFIQLTSIGGLALLSFFTILINLFVAEFYISKKKIYLYSSISIFIMMFVFGVLIFDLYKPTLIGKSFKVAIVSDNSNPETKWNNENGNEFANKYFQLCKDAVALKPDFIIWTETALPWTYTKDDDLLNEIIKISSGNTLTHVIGVNNENISENTLYNSVFYIDNKNIVNGIYNKQILLKGIEEPLGSVLVPFLSQEGFVLSKGKNQEPIQTHFGKAGTLVCNEVVIEKCASEQVKKGANFLFNLSNDGWFKDNYISDLHFYYARLQAVENRKDICVANNCGVNAIISSDGIIVAQIKDTSSTLISGIIKPNNNLSFFTKFPQLFPFLFVLMIMIHLLTFKNLKKKKIK